MATIYYGRTPVTVPDEKAQELIDTGLFTEERTRVEASLNRRVYVQPEEPKRAREGSVWIQPEGS